MVIRPGTSQAIVRQLSGRTGAIEFARHKSGSCQAVDRQAELELLNLLGTRQAVVRQLSGSCQAVVR